MYAIVDIAGQQFRVEKDQKLFVHRLDGEEGGKVAFDRVLLIDTGNNITVGDPVIKGAAVSARIISHVKGDKVLVFKKKRRKGYQKLNGHRQYMTQIQIEGIAEKSAPRAAVEASSPAETGAPAAVSAATPKKPAAAKPAAQKATATPKKTAAKKPEAKSEAAAKKPAAKKPAAKSETAAKKPAAKKPAAKKEDKS